MERLQEGRFVRHIIRLGQVMDILKDQLFRLQPRQLPHFAPAQGATAIEIQSILLAHALGTMSARERMLLSPKHGQKRYSRPMSSGLGDECCDLRPERFFVTFAETHVDLPNETIPANQIA